MNVSLRALLRALDGMDPYELLGVAPDASDEEIKSAYRRLVREVHSDLGGDDDRTKELNLAWTLLSKHRADYDNHVLDPVEESIESETSLWDTDEVVTGPAAASPPPAWAPPPQPPPPQPPPPWPRPPRPPWPPWPPPGPPRVVKRPMPLSAKIFLFLFIGFWVIYIAVALINSATP